MRNSLLAVALLSLGCPKVDHVDTSTSCPPGCPSVVEVTKAPVVADAAAPSVATPAAPGVPVLTSKTVPFPGASGPASLDYIAYEPGQRRVWVPVGATGSVDIYDVASGAFTAVGGFKKEERDINGKKRTMGPSAVTMAVDVAFIGDRATSEVCSIDRKTLKPGPCLKLASPTDGVSYVASAKEVWVTTPKDSSLTILDASKPGALKQKLILKTPGEPEGYAVDEARGVFFTNLEDKGGTLAIDVKTHAITATFDPQCGADGPRGLSFDAKRNFLVVACTDHVQVLDVGHGGARLGKLDTGAGVDNLDLVGDHLYVAAGKAARLTVATIDDQGQLTVRATGVTSEGARNAVADEAGNVYVGDSLQARLFVFAAAQ